MAPAATGLDARGPRTQRSRWRAAALVSMLAVTLATGVGLERFVLVDTAFGGQRHESLEDLEGFETLSAAYDIIRENYIMTGDMTDEELIYGATTGMLDALNDADHSYFMDPDETERNEAGMASQLVGIGVRVEWETIPPRIQFPLANTPAFEAGILPGDEIIAIDGVDPSRVDLDERITMMRGEAGSEITLELRHQGESGTYEVTITRQDMEINPVSWAMLPGEILWVRLDGFPDGAVDRMIEALQAGHDRGAKGVILDLRANSGGWIDQAIQIAGEFEPAGSVVFHDEEGDGEVITYETSTRDGAWQEGPLVVLVDENTASSGELLSATLKDNERATLVGVTTLGLGTSVLFYDLPDNSSMALSVGLWTTPDGDVMLHDGISPHVEVRNAPGVSFALPYLLASDDLSEDDMEELDDVQLLVGYDIVLGMVEDAG
jgi:carboxyl-terminal processing protease